MPRRKNFFMPITDNQIRGFNEVINNMPPGSYDEFLHDAILVCGPYEGELDMPDNLVDKCSMCGKPVQLRPMNIEIKEKLCLGCVKKVAKAAEDAPS